MGISARFSLLLAIAALGAISAGAAPQSKGQRQCRVVLEDGRWPGLAPADLYRGEDLAVTTDFRDVLAEVLVRHLGLNARAAIFPGFGMDARRFPGLFS